MGADFPQETDGSQIDPGLDMRRERARQCLVQTARMPQQLEYAPRSDTVSAVIALELLQMGRCPILERIRVRAMAIVEERPGKVLQIHRSSHTETVREKVFGSPAVPIDRGGRFFNNRPMSVEESFVIAAFRLSTPLTGHPPTPSCQSP